MSSDAVQSCTSKENKTFISGQGLANQIMTDKIINTFDTDIFIVYKHITRNKALSPPKE